MIASKELPAPFAAWNRTWSAPGGRSWPLGRLFRFNRIATRYRGPFAHQSNAETREYEYPWAYSALSPLDRPLNIIDIGGGLSGLQFALASQGHSVTNVDPGGADDTEWGFTRASHAYMTKVFSAPVRLVTLPLEDAGLPDYSADRVLCVSVLEHLSTESVTRCMQAVGKVLRPDGFLVMTVDLFLDLSPFTAQSTGRWGRNIDVREALDGAGLELVQGDKREILGFDEFSVDYVRNNLARYLISTAGSAAQCLIARPRTRS